MMRPVPPGEVLREQLEELGMSATQLASHLGVPTNRITGILNAERSLTADTALRLSEFFGTTPEFWLALQSNYELRKAELESRPAAKITPLWKLLDPQRQAARPATGSRSVAVASSRKAGRTVMSAAMPARARAWKKQAKKASKKRSKKA